MTRTGEEDKDKQENEADAEEEVRNSGRKGKAPREVRKLQDSCTVNIQKHRKERYKTGENQGDDNQEIAPEKKIVTKVWKTLQERHWRKKDNNAERA